jgi:hypothetical protein
MKFGATHNRTMLPPLNRPTSPPGFSMIVDARPD